MQAFINCRQCGVKFSTFDARYMSMYNRVCPNCGATHVNQTTSAVASLGDLGIPPKRYNLNLGISSQNSYNESKPK